MSFEGIDEWDENFLDEAIRVELEVLASRNPISKPPSEPNPFAPPPSLPQQEPFPSRNPAPIRSELESFPTFGFDGGGGHSSLNVSFSPPRELSQRFLEKPESGFLRDDCEIIGTWVSKNGGYGGRGGGGGNKKDKEVERLKRELGRISKQISHMEHECMELQKDRAKKDEQLKGAFSQIEAKDAEIYSLKRANLEASKQDQLQHLQVHNKAVSFDQADHCPISEDRFTQGIPQALERTTKGSCSKSKRAPEPSAEFPLESQVFKTYGPKRKVVQTDGQSAVSELKRRIMIDNSLTTSSGIAVQESSFPEKLAQSKCSKTIGVQTDVVQDCGHIALKNILSAEHDILSKLRAIWVSPSEKRSGRSLISELFVTCLADFCVLFKCMSLPSETNLERQANGSFSDMALHGGMQSSQLNDAAKVSRFYEILMKGHQLTRLENLGVLQSNQRLLYTTFSLDPSICTSCASHTAYKDRASIAATSLSMRNEVAPLQTLLEALLDLCTLENAVVAHKSLRILHAVLQHLSCSTRSDRRKNVQVDQSRNSNFPEDRSIGQENIGQEKQIVNEFKKAYNESETSSFSSSNIRSFDLENLCKNEDRISRTSINLFSESLINLFEKMQQIALSNTEEYIRIEALSIMNLILMGSNPNSEREKFGLMPLLESLSQLLRKEVGLHVQKQAVRLLFLLLNCPKVLLMFCDWRRDDVEHAKTTDGQIATPTIHGGIFRILEGLAECLACGGTGTQELKLRRNVIIMLAFIASSGKSGFKILLYSATPQRVNFLELIIRLLASEMDAEIADFAGPQDFCKERFSFMREALILLNRLASHPAYSKATLGVLTSGNATASLTIDVANRMSRKSRSCWKHDGTKKTQLETEIVDLARLFKARVFAFLGEKDS